MKCFELVKRTDDEIAFSCRNDLEEAWEEWNRGGEVMLTWQVGNRKITEIVDESVMTEFAAGKIKLCAVEPAETKKD